MLAKTIDGHDNAVYGHANNPYDLTLTPGGSSSGEAALIATGGSPIGLGSDSGGSIRYPAHCCGIAGLKPTNGRVPLSGHFPRINALSDQRTQIGPMAKKQLAARDAAWVGSLVFLAIRYPADLAVPPAVEIFRRTWVPIGLQSRNDIRAAIAKIDPGARARTRPPSFSGH